MKNCGLHEYVTTSEDEYVQKATEFANAIDKLRNLKIVVRDAFVNGPICNYKSFVNEFENKLFNLYRNHAW